MNTVPRHPRPSFFIVGAPRCGTTSLTHFLATHPQVFIPEVKVPMHFGADLDIPVKSALRSRDNYLALFESARPDQVCGESSVFYLSSQLAAREIRDFDPAAKIIIMLRHPADMMYSMHARNLLDGNDDELDFARALQLEGERKQGRKLPRLAHYRQGLYYRELAGFAAQVERFQQCFAPEQLRIILMDDIRSDVSQVFASVLRFLGVSDQHAVEPERANSSQAVRSPAVTHLLKSPPAAWRWLPSGVRDALTWRLNRWNHGGAPRPPLDPALRARLSDEFAHDIAALGRLIGRDLSHWTQPATPRRQAA